MSFWWVNQNQTFEQETAGGYLWSPQRNANGARNQFYENMRLIEPGDVVFSFRDTRIPCMGVALSTGYEAPKPDEFGETGQNWGAIGWRVDVRYTRLENVVRPKDFIGELAPTLPDKYSPLRSNGDGLQSVYLAGVPDSMAEVLVAKIGAEAATLVERAGSYRESPEDREQTEENLKATIMSRPDISETEKQALVKSRRGQGLFRQRVLSVEPRCRVTNIDNPDFLIASHIKPWHKCNTNQERLDQNNGLMLSPAIDFLFDRGLISFSDDGHLLISTKLDRADQTKLGLPAEIAPKPFSAEQREYLRYHRDHLFGE